MTNMKKHLRTLAMSLIMIAMSACVTSAETIKPSDNIITKNVTLNDFNAITSAGPFDVVYETGNTCKARITGPDNIVPLVKTDISNGNLSIRFGRDTHISGNPNVTIFVTAPTVSGYSVTGSGSILIKSKLDMASHDIKITVTGSGGITTRTIQCKSLNCSVSGSGGIVCDNAMASTAKASISGSGDITIKGSAGEAVLKVTGSGNIDAGHLAAKHAKASIAGSGTINCNATGSLDASISGSGNIRYAGNPQEVHKNSHFKNNIRPAK